ncbi:MAG: proteasome accessory factor PafA2 family protein, partial [Armatimonadota bacterium]
MKDRMFGIESEYAFVAFDRAGNSLDRERSALMFFEGAQGKLVSLPDIRGRLFLENGSCLYIDCGPHPEFATPECTTPWEAVRYVKAGELILKSLTSVERVESNGARNFVLFRSNVDYSGARTTWGCHESYLHTADPGVLFEQILPHLVSRIIYTGSGGFDNRIRSVRFLLSPRVPHLVRAESDQSTIARGIWHSKDEPLCGNHRGYHRLHVLAGENLCSEKAIFLKVGTTALIVALIEAGMCPGDAVKLRNPVAAMRRFAASTDCTATAPLQGGGQATAIEIQSRYLEAVEANLGRDFMPAWAPRVCAEWRATLERLRDAPASVCTELDWAIKLTCFEHHIASRGVNWNDLNIPFLLSAHRGQIAGERLARLASMLEAFLGPDEDEIELEHDSLVCGSQPDNACVQRSVAEELFVMDLE